MTDQEYCSDWRQVRVFTMDTSAFWYPRLLHTAVSPLSVRKQHHDVFVSKYQAPLGYDDGDTAIESLTPQFLFERDGQQWHSSVRIRFRGNDEFEADLGVILERESSLWYSDFLDYDLQSDLGGSRFCPNKELAASRHRARLIAEVLCANSRVVLDAIAADRGDIRFERNENELNMPLGSTFRSLGHMVSNAWDLSEGGSIPVYVLQRSLYPL